MTRDPVRIPEPDRHTDPVGDRMTADYQRPPRWLAGVLVVGAVGALMTAVISYTTNVNTRVARREDAQHTQDLLRKLKASDDARHGETLVARRRNELLNSCALRIEFVLHPNIAARYGPAVAGDPCRELFGDPAPSATLTTTTTTTTLRRRTRTSSTVTTRTTSTTTRPSPASSTTTSCPTPTIPRHGGCVAVP